MASRSQASGSGNFYRASQQFGGVQRQPSHGQNRQQQPPPPTKTLKPDPWLSGTAPACTTALAMSRDRTRLDKLSFGCSQLDAAFQGGIPVQGITEIVGAAGAGKTQLCLQLLLQAQLAPEEGGLGGKSYVLTCGEGDFPSRRLRQMATRYQKLHGVEPAKLMEGVCIQNAKNLEEQMKILMEHLPVLMGAHNIKLVVVDSIAALFRSDLGRGRGAIGERSRLLGKLSQQMKRLGDRHRAAFVVVNQVTAKFGPAVGRGGGGGGEGVDRGGPGGDSNVPAMGLLWSQCINARFMVRRREGGPSLQPSTNIAQTGSESRDVLLSEEIGDQGNPPPPSTFAAAGADGGGSRRVTSASREITLEMSPSVPVNASCAFVIERDGVSGVGRR